MAQVCFEIGLFRRAAKRFLDFRFRVYNVRYTSFYSEDSLIIESSNEIDKWCKTVMTREKSFDNQAFVVRCDLGILDSKWRAFPHFKALDRARV